MDIPCRRALKILLWLLPAVFLCLFYFYPLAAILKTAIGDLQNRISLAELWQNIAHVLGFTIWQALLSLAVTLVLGLPLAFLFGRYRFRGKELLWTLLMLPFILPTVVVAAGFNALIGDRGWINLLLMNWLALPEPPLQLLYSLPSILMAHVFYNTTIIVRVVGSFLAQMDIHQEQAARSLGATPMRVLMEIILPLSAPAILSSALLVFLFDFMSFGVILILGGPRFSTLEPEMYIQAINMLNLPLASILSIIQMICTLLVAGLSGWLNRSINVPLNPCLQYEGEYRIAGRWPRMVAGAGLLLIFLFFVSPLAALVMRSLVRMEGAGYQITFDYYRELFINRQQSLFYVPPISALLNSLIYGLATLIISLSLGFLAVYGMRSRTFFSRLMSLIFMLPLGTSPVALGLGYIIVISVSGLPVDAYPFFIPFVHSLVALPFVIRTLQPALISIPTEMKFAAAILGASPFRTWREVELPILLRATGVAAIFAFTLSLGEFGATSFLSRPEYPTIPVAIYRFFGQPGELNYGQAMAMSSILLVVCAVCIICMDRIQKIGRQVL